MRIHEVCRQCDVTKKAVEYYERHGLLSPAVLENGYRDYSATDLRQLREIALYRRLEIDISSIKVILSSEDKIKALGEVRTRMKQRTAVLVEKLGCLDRVLCGEETLDEAFRFLSSLDVRATVKERLIQAFPGRYGQYLCIHFGSFLGEQIDSVEKDTAYRTILTFLDSVSALEFPKELEDYFDEAFSLMQISDMERVQQSMRETMENVEEYMRDNEEQLKTYIRYRGSEEFKESSAGKMQALFLAFAQSVGYYEIFIPNLKILSASYCEYTERMQTANEKFLESYPQAKSFYADEK